MKKTILINASPRKKWNTAHLLKAAEAGACEAGAETEYVDLYDVKGTGCRSCLACKKKDGRRCHCFWPDGFSPLIDSIFAADAVIIGTPIYFGEPIAQFRALVERLIFCSFSYDDYSSYVDKKINVGLIYTMNAPYEYYEKTYKEQFKRTEDLFRYLKGTVSIYAACNTLQVEDYSKFNMASFSETEKKEHQEFQFPKDMAAVKAMAARLSQ